MLSINNSCICSHNYVKGGFDYLIKSKQFFLREIQNSFKGLIAFEKFF